ncbi:MAG TPA: hypothetical protein VFK57_02655 [Vicinamibacterales bacterium]|nr:hypothetical protein [Vicinamibacterales bacterium]
MRSLSVPVLLCAALACPACSDSGHARARETTRPTYDKATGRLKELTYDANRNGTIDTWTEMDGARPVRSRIDRDEDGRIDRWEYYDASGALAKVGFSRRQSGAPDAWAFSGPDGEVERVESSSTGDEAKIDRREFYARGAITRSEADTNADGRVDQWETYESGVVKTVARDENADGRPDRRLTYGAGGALVSIESDPDPSGSFRKRVIVR